MSPQDRQLMIEALDASAWTMILRELVSTMRAWSKDLLENPDLAESDRRGKVLALNEMKSRISGIYAKVGRDLPPWLQKEVWFYRD